MKLNKLFFMAAMGLGLIACTENDLVEGGDSNGAQNEGSTYVGFTIDFSKTQTRATTETGTDAEQKINTAYVILADGNIISQVVSSADEESSKYVLKTTPGPHDFYVVVNPTTAPTTSNTVSEYFNTGVAIGAEEFAKTTAGSESFLMASVKKETFDIADGITEEEALEGTDAATNNFTINVERVAAKVTMTCENTALTNATNNADGTITTPKFTLKGGATKSYRMAQNPFAEIAGNVWTYTSNAAGTEVYVKDGEETDLHKKATPVYCLENIHNTGAYLQTNTTYLNLNTKFVPAKVVNCDSEETVGALKDNPNAATSTAASFYVVKTGSLAGNYILKDELDAFQGGDATKFPNGVESISAEYENGTCWFGPIWIGQTDTDKDNAPVIRNTWYNLKITGITLPGDPEEPTIDPEQPLTPATNVAITLSVMPWNFIDREISLQ